VAYVKVATSVRKDEKFIDAGPEASWLWLCGLLYARELRTDGFVPEIDAPFLGVRQWRRHATVLEKCGLWLRVDDGWTVVVSKSYRPSLNHLLNQLTQFWGHACAYCAASDVGLEVEHVIPWSRGGSNDITNLVPACKPCNRRKGTRTAAEFGFPDIQGRAARIH
jgi:hypothetical protein